MKKISLKNLNLKEVEQLSREQLKNVLGGGTAGGPITTKLCPTAGLPECWWNGVFVGCLTFADCVRDDAEG